MKEAGEALTIFAGVLVVVALGVGGLLWLVSTATCAEYTRAEYQRNEAPEYCYDK